MSLNLVHNDNYTIRFIEGPVEFDQDVCETVQAAVRFTMDALNLPGHLFVTVLGANTMKFGEGEDECGFGLYHSGMQHVAICGGVKPDDVDCDKEEWSRQIFITVVHEIVHYWQELRGQLDGSDMVEILAEGKTDELMADAEAIGIVAHG